MLTNVSHMVSKWQNILKLKIAVGRVALSGLWFEIRVIYLPLVT